MALYTINPERLHARWCGARFVLTNTSERRSLWLYRSINLAQLLWELAGQGLLTFGSKVQGYAENLEEKRDVVYIKLETEKLNIVENL